MYVLYIEDDRFDADLTVHELHRHAPHIKIDTAPTLIEARSRLTEDCKYDLVLIDLHLRDASGLQILNEIRNLSLPVAVVIITGLGDEGSAIAALKAGADDYITKREGYLLRLPNTLETALLRFRAESARINQPLRVLYAEYNTHDIDLTQRHIARHAQHIQIEVVQSSQDTIQRLTKNGKDSPLYDILLLDYHLPGFNALELVKILNDDYNLDLPVVLVTGRGNEEVAANALRLGVYNYVVKHQGYLFELPSVLESAFNRHQLKKEKTALKFSEAQYRVLSETALDYIIAHDLEGGITFANQAAIASCGYSREEMLGMNVADFVPREHLEELMRRQKTRLAGGEGRYLYETEFMKKTGQTVPVEISSSAIVQNGEVHGVLLVARDISQRKEAENALIKSERKYRTLFETMTQGVIYRDANGRILDANPAAEAILELRYDQILAQKVVTSPSRTIKIDGSDFPPEEFSFMEALRTGRTVKNTIIGLHNPVTDETRWLSFSSVPQFRNGETKPYQVYTTFEDITKRKRAEDEVRALSERLRHYFTTSPTITYALKIEGKNVEILWVSENINRIMGYREEEVLTPDWWYENIHPDDRERAENEKKALYTTRSLVQEYRFLAKDGKVYWIRDESRLFRDDRGASFEIVGSLTDISERIKSENRIRHLNRVLRAIREINHLIVHERNAGELIQKACNTLISHRGYNSVLIILVDESNVPQQWAQAGSGGKFQTTEEMLAGGRLPECCNQAGFSNEIYFLTENNACCISCPRLPGCSDYATMCKKLQHGDKVFGFLSVSIDGELGIEHEEQSIFMEMAGDLAFGLYNIAQTKAIIMAEKERKDMEAELRQAQKMEAIGRLAGGVVHDFNNMLSVISGYANLALTRMDPEDPLYQHLCEIDQAAMRSADLTGQLLAFSRKQVVTPKILDLNKILTDQIKMLGRLIGEDVEIKFTPAHDLWPILIDPSQIHQILANLAVNARDAIDGVGLVNIETANVAFDGPTPETYFKVKPGEYVMISFTDTGSGIETDILEHIFEPFFTTKGEGRGTGLGLSTVYGIVKQNDGAIHVYSEYGLGTSFKIYLPRYRGKVETAGGPERTIDLNGSETILVVEDDNLVLNLAKSILERRGYKVITAGMPDEALIIAQNYKDTIHLLLTDVVMPTMNGKELNERVKTFKPGIKTLFMSGYTADIISRHGVLEKGINFIQKPFTLDSLSEKVRRVFDD